MDGICHLETQANGQGSPNWRVEEPMGCFEMKLPNTHNHVEITFGHAYVAYNTDYTDRSPGRVFLSIQNDSAASVFEQMAAISPETKTVQIAGGWMSEKKK